MSDIESLMQPGGWDGEDYRWEDDAACGGMDLELFFPSRGDGPDKVATAKAVCAQCPVRYECLLMAITTHQNVGVFGGLSAKERRALKKTMQPMTPMERGEAIREASETVVGAKVEQAG